jgi:hypothetical protein
MSKCRRRAREEDIEIAIGIDLHCQDCDRLAHFQESYMRKINALNGEGGRELSFWACMGTGYRY